MNVSLRWDQHPGGRQLELRGEHLHTTSCEISFITTQINVSGPLTNHGLIDGGDTLLTSPTSALAVFTGTMWPAASSLWNGEEDGHVPRGDRGARAAGHRRVQHCL